MKFIIAIAVVLFANSATADDHQATVDAIAEKAGIKSATVIVKTHGIDTIAYAAFGKTSGKSYIFINKPEFKEVRPHKRADILVHELAHIHVKNETGKASHRHGTAFKKACKMIAEAANANVTFACKAK